ncbi:hypothetical protein L2E82_53468 [Cichorium intybus]|nr:hypothetical protein L2E82_53468 [Cichorium intybus]
MRLRRKSLQPKSAEEPSDVPALLIECQHVAVLSVKKVAGAFRSLSPFFSSVRLSDDDVELTAEKDLGIQASRPVVWTASDILEEGGDDVKSAWPLWAGPHTCYNGNYNGKQGCKAERIRKDCLSSDCSLQLGNMKLESLVAVGEPVAGLNPSRWKFPSREACTLSQLPAFQRCLEDGPDAAERRPGSGFPTGGGGRRRPSQGTSRPTGNTGETWEGNPDWESEDP